MVRNLLSHSGTTPTFYAKLKETKKLDMTAKRKPTVQVGTRVSIWWPDDAASYEGVVVDFDVPTKTHTIHYDDGDTESLNLAEEKFEVIVPPVQQTKKLAAWAEGIQQHVAAELAQEGASETETADITELICSALADTTITNYKSKVQRFVTFCTTKGLQPLPCSRGTALRYMRDLHDSTSISTTSYNVYTAAVNSWHTDLGYQPPFNDHLVNRAQQGSESLLNTESEAVKRYWIPADAVSQVLDLALSLFASKPLRNSSQLAAEMDPTVFGRVQLLRACVFLSTQFAFFCRSDTGTSALNSHVAISSHGITLLAVKQKGKRRSKFKPVYRIPVGAIEGLDVLLRKWVQLKKTWKQNGPDETFWGIPGDTQSKFTNVQGTEWTRLALDAVGAEPPMDFKYDGHGSRSGSSTAANAIGVALTRICFMADWSIQSSAVHDYIDLSAPATEGARRFFGWLLPSLTHGTS